MKIHKSKKIGRTLVSIFFVLFSFSNTALAGSEISIGRIDYADGTHEASQLYSTENGSCEKYTQLMQEGIWKILDLKCYDTDGNFKEYINGKLKSDTPVAIEKEALQQEGLLKKAEFEARMAESESKGFWSAIWIAIIVGLGTGLITSFLGNYIFASNSARESAIERTKKILKFWKK